MMLVSIVLGAPVWVWPLLALLVWVGLRASRQRSTHVYSIYLMPLLGLISIASIARLPEPQRVWAFYATAYLVGAGVGYLLQARWLLGRRGTQVTLAGEWLTFSAVMTVFFANFCAGTLKALNPDMYADPLFLSVFPATVALMSGTFLGRALRVAVASLRSADRSDKVAPALVEPQPS